jgi:hypothetical protein
MTTMGSDDLAALGGTFRGSERRHWSRLGGSLALPGVMPQRLRALTRTR